MYSACMHALRRLGWLAESCPRRLCRSATAYIVSPLLLDDACVPRCLAAALVTRQAGRRVVSYSLLFHLPLSHHLLWYGRQTTTQSPPRMRQPGIRLVQDVAACSELRKLHVLAVLFNRAKSTCTRASARSFNPAAWWNSRGMGEQRARRDQIDDSTCLYPCIDSRVSSCTVAFVIDSRRAMNSRKERRKFVLSDS